MAVKCGHTLINTLEVKPLFTNEFIGTKYGGETTQTK